MTNTPIEIARRAGDNLVRAARRKGEQRDDIWKPPLPNRGDYPLWIAVVLYCISAAGLVTLTYFLLPNANNLLVFLILFAFLYNPFISYVNARLLGISGQQIMIPFVKESAFLLSGAKGIDIWLAPVPLYNFGRQAQSFRVNELTGVSFWSLIKPALVALPILFVLSVTFWGFIWHSDAIPSEMFPAARINQIVFEDEIPHLAMQL